MLEKRYYQNKTQLRYNFGSVYPSPYMLISVKIKDSHAAYNGHSNNIVNQPTV